MNTNDLLLRWSHMSLDQIEDEIRSGKDQDSAVQLLGAQTVAQMQAVSFAPPTRSAPDPVVLMPGIMGSDLTSIRGLTSLIWINPLMFLQGNARYLGLTADNTQDAFPEVEIVPVGLAKLYYIRMELALNHSAELFEFPYDWRRPVVYNADVLHNCLERWAGDSDRKFTLVAHSMGGLVSRAYMARYPDAAEKRVRRLVMLGTPNYGATNAVMTLLTGNDLMQNVNGLNKANDMVNVVRALPGVYNLLPAPQEYFPSSHPYPVDFPLYEADAWHTPGIQQALLDNTVSLYHALATSDPQVPMTMIAGCNLDTLVGLSYIFGDQGATKITPTRVSTGDNSGDATVPLWSSLMKNIDVFYIQEKHGNLPANGKVIDAVLALLQDQAPQLATTLPEPKPFLGISFATRDTSPQALADRINSGTATQDDIDQLQFAL